MSTLNLLIVEDDSDQIASYKRDIKSFNLDSEVKIEYSIETDSESALTILEDEKSFFDAAIVDLKLDKDGKEDKNYTGNEVLKKIKGSLRFPVFVITGTPQHLDEDLKEESPFFKVLTRGEDNTPLESIVKLYNTGITNILGKKGVIEKYLSDIFWKHISTSIHIWMEDEERPPYQKEKTLLRYTLLHLQEYLELTEEEGFEFFHPGEVYITPPVKPMVFTGDIIQEIKTNNRFVVVTPACDLAQSKAKLIQFIGIEERGIGIINNCISILNKKGSESEEGKSQLEILKKLTLNGFSNKYHFLPKYGDIEAGLANFQKINSVSTKDFNHSFRRIASLNGSFSKDLVARFSYYYSRQGAPGLHHNELVNSLIPITSTPLPNPPDPLSPPEAES